MTDRLERSPGDGDHAVARPTHGSHSAAREHELAILREHFFVVLAHDLKNPLASIAAATRLLTRNPDGVIEMSAHIDRSIARIVELIDNIFDFARGKSGVGFGARIDKDQPLESTLVQVIDEIRIVHPTRTVIVDLRISDAVQCDAMRIGQLLSNLLSNAMVYGDPAAPVRIHGRTHDGALELSVANAGPTIEAFEIERLFRPFVRGEATGDRNSLGLGLYICSEIAKAHEGTISVTSRNGTTCFTLRIPCTTGTAERQECRVVSTSAS